jgi:hypothetical protein
MRICKSNCATFGFALVALALATRPACAGDDPPIQKAGPGYGTLGYGPPGVHPGFQGFGLGYHAGHGYGGRALGVGATGGYPFYGGPGYPHAGPRLRRIGGTEPFRYCGGCGNTVAHGNHFGLPGPLASSPLAIQIAPTAAQAPYGTGYGAFTGTLPYPESTFAPYSSGNPTNSAPR